MLQHIDVGRRARRARLRPEKLAADLRDRIRGEVRFDDGSRALYATDGSNYRQVPIGVVIPLDTADLVATIDVCRAHGAPVLTRGGGTSLAGQCCNVAVVIDASKHLVRILDVDPHGRTAVVEPGVVLDWLRDAAEHHHLTFGPDPSTHNHCTLGGMIGNNSCGVHSVMAGRTADNVHELEVLTYDGLRLRVGPTPPDELARIIAAGGRRGEIYAGMKKLIDRVGGLVRERYPKIPRRVSGYNLDELLPENGFHVARALVGSEGTLVTILEAKLRLVPSPPVRSLLVLGYPDVYQAGDHVPEVMEAQPTATEGLDDRLISDMKKLGLHPEGVEILPDGNGFLLVEFGGDTKREADDKARALMDRLRRRHGDRAPSMKLFDDRNEEKIIWKVRESGLGATAHVPGAKETWEGWEDSAVPPDRLGEYLRKLRALFDRYGYACALYGHFGQGCVHTRIDFGLRDAEGIRKYVAFIEEAAELVVGLGGSLSGEHGDGQSRAQLLPKMFGPVLVGAFAEFKSIWDPAGKMNPGKVVHAHRVDENLRLGADYRPWTPETHFSYAEDKHSFAEAALRCVGVGECRRAEGGTMCPSYRVTREEKHSTRGRARMLFELLRGEVVKGRWRDRHVKESLDLCLSCKGCKSDCPVFVDMATYKAEFLSHHYAGRLRPRAAYTMGLIMIWARLAALAPRVVNLLVRTPILGRIVKWLGGVAQARTMPRFAPETFRAWFARNRGAGRAGAEKRVILWPDTFVNHFSPEIGIAAVEVLEAAGFAVRLPPDGLCCGRPLYDFGMLDRAERELRRILEALRPALDAGIPIVGLEPSCVAVFRDELPNLLPDDEDAKRLSKHTFILSEFLQAKAPSWPVPPLRRKALVHGHCHHKSVIGFDDEQKVLKKMGVEADVLDSGCCGMAGSFGFEAGEKHDVSRKVGELVLLPRVRRAAEDTLILADGFSCRQQIEQGTRRRGLHLAQALQMALRHGAAGVTGVPPERHLDAPTVRGSRGAVLAAVAVAAVGLAWLARRRLLAR